MMIACKGSESSQAQSSKPLCCRAVVRPWKNRGKTKQFRGTTKHFRGTTVVCHPLKLAKNVRK